MRLIVTLVLAALFMPLDAEARSGTKPFVVRRSEAVVREVVDGDTVKVLKDGAVRHVRLLFIDTMESKDNPKVKKDVQHYAQKGVIVRKKDMIALGKLAAIYLRSLLKSGDRVTLEGYQGNLKDRYGRLLAVVYKKGTNVNLQLVREGYARVYFLGRVPPEVKAAFQREENSARSAKKVIWNYLE